MVGDLADLGYDARWYGLRAADVGAAHGRFRVFLYATPADASSDGRWPNPRPGQPNGLGIADGVGRRGADDLTLLPTPAVNYMGEGKTVDHWDAWTATMQAKHGNGNGHGKSLAIEAQRLLPTPTVNDAGNVGGESQFDRNTVPLSHALLPTPRATDGTKGGPNQRGSSGDLMLPSAVQLLPTPDVGGGGKKVPEDARWSGNAAYKPDGTKVQVNTENAVLQNWGDYAPAIARWEHVIGRPAPAPTEPGPKGNPRLSARFVEWLMGLPAGHVTDVDIPRNAQLKALGNGVVPPQSAAATRAFVEDITTDRALAGAS